MNIAILISGRGSNMLAVIEAAERGELPGAEIAVVVSDKAEAAGLPKAREHGIETLIVERRGRKREEHDAEIIAELRKRNISLICLAGYMRLLSKSFVEAFPEKIINIHPSLLPAFKGLDAQRQALEYGVKFSGCTVHYVDEHLDHGKIIAQEVVEVLPDDTAESLSARILEKEHKLYIAAIQSVIKKTNAPHT